MKDSIFKQSFRDIKENYWFFIVLAVGVMIFLFLGLDIFSGIIVDLMYMSDHTSVIIKSLTLLLVIAVLTLTLSVSAGLFRKIHDGNVSAQKVSLKYFICSFCAVILFYVIPGICLSVINFYSNAGDLLQIVYMLLNWLFISLAVAFVLASTYRINTFKYILTSVKYWITTAIFMAAGYITKIFSFYFSNILFPLKISEEDYSYGLTAAYSCNILFYKIIYTLLAAVCILLLYEIIVRIYISQLDRHKE
ncbi:MAG: hypothetical protein Q8865_00685 [Bacillota bacterium]|nr:hypothetical protein [Bacillota bacterium]